MGAGGGRNGFPGIPITRLSAPGPRSWLVLLTQPGMFHWIETSARAGRDPQKELCRLPLALSLPEALCFVCQDQLLPCWLGSPPAAGTASLMRGDWSLRGPAAVGAPAGQEAELPRGLDDCVSLRPFPRSLLGSPTNVACAPLCGLGVRGAGWGPRANAGGDAPACPQRTQEQLLLRQDPGRVRLPLLSVSPVAGTHRSTQPHTVHPRFRMLV